MLLGTVQTDWVHVYTCSYNEHELHDPKKGLLWECLAMDISVAVKMCMLFKNILSWPTPFVYPLMWLENGRGQERSNLCNFVYAK